MVSRKDNILGGENASHMILMLVAEGLPLRDAKNHVFTLWERGELPFLELEQERRKVPNIKFTNQPRSVPCACPGVEYLWHPQVTSGWKCPDCDTVVFE